MPGSDASEHDSTTWRFSHTNSLPDRSPAASTTCHGATMHQQHTPTSLHAASGGAHAPEHLAAEIIRGEEDRRRRNRMASEKCRRRKIEKFAPVCVCVWGRLCVCAWVCVLLFFMCDCVCLVCRIARPS